MDIDIAFPSNYLKAADLKGHPIRAKISGVEIRDVGGQNKKEEHKPVLGLEGHEKGIVLNKTNASILKEDLGTSETTEWVGKEIEAYADQTEFRGKRVDSETLRQAAAAGGDGQAGGHCR